MELLREVRHSFEAGKGTVVGTRIGELCSELKEKWHLLQIQQWASSGPVLNLLFHYERYNFRILSPIGEKMQCINKHSSNATTRNW